MTDEKGQTVRLEIDSELANTSLIAMAVRGLCAMTNLSPVEVNRVELCVVEIVNNAIEHAYGHAKGHKVEIDVKLMKASITLTVSDWGKSMDEGKLGVKEFPVDPDNPAAWLCDGRGLPIVQSLMDKVEYRSVGDKNSIVMSKQIRT